MDATDFFRLSYEDIVEKVKLAMQTDNALHGMELTIQLPTPQLAL